MGFSPGATELGTEWTPDCIVHEHKQPTPNDKEQKAKTKKLT